MQQPGIKKNIVALTMKAHDFLTMCVYGLKRFADIQQPEHLKQYTFVTAAPHSTYLSHHANTAV